MARDTTVYSLAYVAAMIGQSRELIEVVAANSDNIDYGEMIQVHDGTDASITAFTARGIESLQKFLADVRSSTGGIRQFVVDQACEPELVDRIMAHERKR